MSLQRESKVSELQGFRRGHVYISYYYFVDIRSYLSKCPLLLRELSIFLAALYSESWNYLTLEEKLSLLWLFVTISDHNLEMLSYALFNQQLREEGE